MKGRIPKSVEPKTLVLTILLLVTLLTGVLNYASSQPRTLTIILPSFVETATYIVWNNGSTYYAKNGATGEIEFSSADAASVIQSVIDALTNGGKIYIEKGTFELTSALRLKDKIAISVNPSATIDGSSLSDDMVKLSNVECIKITGGKWITCENYVAFNINDSKDVTVAPEELTGLGGGIYAHGTTTDCRFYVPYAYQLGKNSSLEIRPQTNGVTVYLEENCERITVPIVNAYDCGNENSWVGGMYAGRNIHVGQVTVRHSYGGGVGMGFENHPIRDSVFDSIIGDTLNSYACCVYKATRIQIGHVYGYKCGMVTSPYEYEPAFGIYGYSESITVGEIIAEENGGTGVIIDSNTGDTRNIHIGRIITKNNGQKAGAYEIYTKAGMQIYASGGHTIDDIHIDSLSTVDTQAVNTQFRGLYIGCSSGSTLSNLHINHIYYNGNLVAPIGYGIGGTFSNVYLAEREVKGTTLCTTSGTTITFSSLGFHDQPDTNYQVIATPHDLTDVKVIKKQATSFTLTVGANCSVDWMLNRG